jgi:hypothetical protein
MHMRRSIGRKRIIMSMKAIKRRTPAPDRSTVRRRIGVRRVVLTVVALMIVVIGIRLVQVHDQTWEWRLGASAAPTKLQFGGRDYLRDASAPNPQLLGAVKVGGRASGGGLVLVPSVAADPY